MATGIALTIGLNSVDPKHYGGWSGELNACEADAGDMAQIATDKKFKVNTMLTNNATRNNVINEILNASKALKSGDIFMISYSGHGGQIKDLNGDEPDMQDETWCLYDGEIVDDELYNLYAKFAQGVRVLVFSDSCHSGSVTKELFLHGTAQAPRSESNPQGVRYRFMPRGAALRTYQRNKDFYDKILSDKTLTNKKDDVKASVLLISGCQDNQLSADGDFNGLFTGNLLRVWKSGKYAGNYKEFHRAIVRCMPPNQTPNYFRVGQINQEYEKQKPFTI